MLYSNYGDDGSRLSGETSLCRDCIKSHCDCLIALRKLDDLAKKVEDSVRNCDVELRNANGRMSDSFHGNKCLIGKDSLKEWKKVAKTMIENRDRDPRDNIFNSQEEDWVLNEELRCTHRKFSLFAFSINLKPHFNTF